METLMQRTLISNGNPMERVVGFARAVRVGPFIAVGGTAPVGPDGKTVGVGDPAAQARRCLEIIKDALERAGSGMSDVVRTRVLLTRIEDWKTVIQVRAEYFSEIRPVDTIMQVGGFVNPEWLVEFEVDAVVSDGAQPVEVGSGNLQGSKGSPPSPGHFA
jgi:enamine deaminase RidA (YjgF/YER057c/UK114 family)